MTKVNSKQQILKSSVVIGGASLLTIIIGLVKVKILAELLGPAGIGLMGILVSMMGLGATIFGMGLTTSGVRDLALNYQCSEKLDSIRKALFSANLFLGLLGLFLIIFFKKTLSLWFFDTVDFEFTITVIAIGVFSSLISGSQTTLMQGLRKINELAMVKVIGAISATFIGLLFVWWYGEVGLSLFVITVPVVTCIVAFYYNRQIPKVATKIIQIKYLVPQWQSLFSIGFPFMLTGLMTVGCQLIIRYIINQKLDLESVGYFQAAWQISMTYITFMLGAMAADYYPRLTQQMQKKSESNRLVNEQTEVAIIFSAPILLAMITFAPIVINLLYSSLFVDSIEILRWQVFGDVLKVISWPLGFIILAKGASKTFFCTELLWNACYLIIVYIGIDFFGIEITGYAFAASYLLLLFVVVIVSRNINDFMWGSKNIKLIVSLVLSSALILCISYYTFVGTMIVGTILTFLFFIYALKSISELEIKNKHLIKIANLCNRFCLIKNKK
ncbi:O-antigen translocase [Shewanella frigidimarina]|uniref:O-antigen translocase n=1 Tax=Shewanella frigidimarina TaxID=56812 RepID=UPI003D7AB179